MQRSNDALAEPFFLAGSAGALFAIRYAPREGTTSRGEILYIPPFAEEMNVARLCVARQARQLARSGFGVLVVDLFGCGDSAGEMRDATWQVWKEDLAAAQRWLSRNNPGPLSLWGLRLGALLAMDYASEVSGVCDQIVLWRPVLSGRDAITQLLHLGLANSSAQPPGCRESLASLRRRLRAGNAVEVAGYELTPGLVQSIEQATLIELGVKVRCPIHWIEAVSEPHGSIPTACLRVRDAWRLCGVDLSMHLVPGKPLQYGRAIFDGQPIFDIMMKVFGGSSHGAR